MATTTFPLAKAESETKTLTRPVPFKPALAPLPDLTEYEEVAATLGFRPYQLDEHKAEAERREMIEFLLDNGMPMYANPEVHAYMAKLAEAAGKVFAWVRLSSGYGKTTRNPVRQSLGQNVNQWGDSVPNEQLDRIATFMQAQAQTNQDMAVTVGAMGGGGGAGGGWSNTIAGIFGGGMPMQMQGTSVTQIVASPYEPRVRTANHGQLIPGPYRHAIPLTILKHAAKIKQHFGDQVDFYASDYAVIDPDPFIMVKRGNAPHIVFGVWDEPGWGVNKT